MWRVLIYLAVIAALASGAVWLAEQPGAVAFVWNGVSYSVGLAVAALALLVLVAAILLVEAAARIVLNLPQRLSGAARDRKKRKAIQALSRGMVAVGSGDENAARRYAREAERYLRKDEPLLMLLKAQAAQISGDRDLAEQTFLEMSQNEETRVLGLRGLYVESRRRGDAQTAFRHASEAARLAPAVDWANEAVLEGLCAQGDWRGAIEAVERRAALGLIDKTTARRQRAVLLTADALARGEADEDGALAAAREAVKLAPDLAPAAAIAGRILGRRLDLRKASSVVETAWAACQHPDLADAYTHLRAGDSALDRVKRAEKLATLSNWSPEGRMALARAALDARDFARARQTLAPILSERPSVGVCVLMAELERLEKGSTAGAREWLARAVHAPRDKAWIADGVVSDRWSPVSPVSGRLDAFRWETPPELISGAGAGVVDDVVADLDDRAQEPVGIPAPREEERAAAPARGPAPEAVVIPPRKPDGAPRADRDAVEAETVQTAQARPDAKAQPDAKAASMAAQTIATPGATAAGAQAAKAGPAQSGLAEQEPAKVEPAKVEPLKVEPAKVETVKAETAKAETAKVEAAKEQAEPRADVRPAEGDDRVVPLVRPPDDPGVPADEDEDKPRKTSRFGIFG